jgi:hypothetical protein
VGEETRWCSGCDDWLPLARFYRHNGRPYGPCRACKTKATAKNRRARAKELRRLRAVEAALTALLNPMPAHRSRRAVDGHQHHSRAASTFTESDPHSAPAAVSEGARDA